MTDKIPPDDHAARVHESFDALHATVGDRLDDDSRAADRAAAHGREREGRRGAAQAADGAAREPRLAVQGARLAPAGRDAARRAGAAGVLEVVGDQLPGRGKARPYGTRIDHSRWCRRGGPWPARATDRDTGPTTRQSAFPWYTLARNREHRSRNPPRPLRRRRAHRGGGHGRGLPRARRAARPRGRDQGAARAPTPRTPTACGASSRRRARPARLNHPNVMAIYDIGTHDGAPYVVAELLEGADAARAARAAARSRRARRVDYAAADRAGPRRRAREGHRPPRSQARERLRDERRPRQDPRLRPGQAHAARDVVADDRGADARRAARSPDPCSAPSATCRPSRCAARPPTPAPTSSRSARCSTSCSSGHRAVPRQLVGRRDERDPEGGSGPARRDRPQRAGPARAARLALPREERRRSASSPPATSPTTSRPCRGFLRPSPAAPRSVDRARAAQAARRGGAARRRARRRRWPRRGTGHETESPGAARFHAAHLSPRLDRFGALCPGRTERRLQREVGRRCPPSSS